MKYLRKKLKSVIAVVCAFLMVSMVLNIPTYAAYTRKCYLIRNANTTVYSNSGLTWHYGTIYGSDEITVLSVTDRYCRVSYPISRLRSKTGYIPTNAILTGTSGNTYTASAQVTTYRRPYGYSYEYISRGDKVTILGTYGDYTQVKYPVSNGYKYGFVTNANANSYIKNTNSGNGSANIANGTYKIATALNTNYVLDVNNYATFNGGNVEIYPYHNTNNEKWNVISLGNGYYRIKDVNSGKSLDVNGGGSASGTNVQIWEQNNTNAQKWRFVDAGNRYYYIINANGCYLDVQNGQVKNGNNVWVYTRNRTNAQKWKLTSVSTTSSSNTPSGNSQFQNKVGQTVANISSYYYTNGNLSYRGGYKGQCTWYAYGRFYEVNGIALKTARHAKYWLSDNQNDRRVKISYTIQPKSIAVRTSGSYGHVMFVEDVTFENGIQYVYYTECNADGNGIYNAGKDCIVKKLSYSEFKRTKNPAGYIVKR